MPTISSTDNARDGAQLVGGPIGSGAATGFALAPFFGLQIGDTYGDATMWAFFASISIVAAALGAVAAHGVRTRSVSEGLGAGAAVT